jgi:hypothetical protein
VNGKTEHNWNIVPVRSLMLHHSPPILG